MFILVDRPNAQHDALVSDHIMRTHHMAHTAGGRDRGGGGRGRGRGRSNGSGNGRSFSGRGEECGGGGGRRGGEGREGGGRSDDNDDEDDEDGTHGTLAQRLRRCMSRLEDIHASKQGQV